MSGASVQSPNAFFKSKNYATRDAAKQNAKPLVGDILTCARYTAGGPALDGLRYRIAPAGTVPFDGVDLTFDKSNVIGVLIVDQRIDVRCAGAIVDGASDDHAPIQRAINYAVSRGVQCYLPPGTAVVTQTLTVGRVVICGAGDASRIKPIISDGTPLFDIPQGTNFVDLRAFRINGGVSQSDYISSAASAANCTGIKINSNYPTVNSARFLLRDVTVQGCAVGYDIDGFIGDLHNVWALECDLGLRGRQFNAVRLMLRFEQCRQDFDIQDSAGIHFDNWLTEGGHLQSGLLPSVIDNCHSVTFTAPYFEQARNVPFLRVGGTSECKAIALNGMAFAAQDVDGSDYNAALLDFDRVDGLEIGGYMSTGSRHNRYTTTQNTKNVTDRTVSNTADNYGPNDNSMSLSQCLNHFPNPRFDLWFRGWPAVSKVRCTASQEQNIVRSGCNALKIQYQAGQASSAYVDFVLNDGVTASALAGKTCSVYAWVWIPDTPDFDANDKLTQRVQPYIAVTVNGTGGGTVTTGTHNTMRGAWNLFKRSVYIPVDATEIRVKPSMSLASGSATGGEYIVVDSVFVVEGDGIHTTKIINGLVADSPMIASAGIAGRLIQYVQSVPTDADQSYQPGDRFVYLNPGASYESVVTVGGTGDAMTTVVR